MSSLCVCVCMQGPEIHLRLHSQATGNMLILHRGMNFSPQCTVKEGSCHKVHTSGGGSIRIFYFATYSAAVKIFIK